MSCDVCRQLLSQGLELCQRARQMDAQDRTEAALSISGDPEAWKRHGLFERYVDLNNESRPHAPMTPHCGTVALWVQDQYDKDLFAWEAAARLHLLHACPDKTGAEIVQIPGRLARSKRSKATMPPTAPQDP